MAEEIRKIGANDLELATGGSGVEEYTLSPGGKYVTKVDAQHIQMRNTNENVEHAINTLSNQVLTGAVITGDFVGNLLELELMKMNFQSISWAQLAVFDAFEDSSKRASPDLSVHQARVFEEALDNNGDLTPSREFGFISKTYPNITTIVSSVSTNVGGNFLEDTTQSWFINECTNLTLRDADSFAFTVTGNTTNTISVVGTPVSGGFILIDHDPAYAVAFATYLDSTNGGAGYVKLEVAFNGVDRQIFLDTENNINLLGGTVLITYPGRDYIVHITLKNGLGGVGPKFYKFLVCTDPSPWRF